MDINKNSLPEDRFSIIEFFNIRKSYVPKSLGIPVLSDVNFKIDSGEFLAAMGSPGSGKSTLVNLIGLLGWLTEGQILVRRMDRNRMSDQELVCLRGLEIRFVFQTFYHFSHLTDIENFLLPTFASSRISIDPRRHVSELLEIMRLHNCMCYKPSELLGVQSKRFSIACTLVNDFEILLVDGPTRNLAA